MTVRTLPAAVALMLFCGCQCINPRDVVGFRCGEGDTCETGMTCCNDGFCRADCSTAGTGGGGSTGGGSATAGGGGAGGGDTAGGTGGSGGNNTGGGSGGGTGGGSACVPKQACTGNAGAPCKQGETSCTGNQSLCVDGSDAPDGTTCRMTDVCVAGACTTCMNGTVCATNPNKCVEGAILCGLGAPICEDTTKQLTPGSSCGMNQVCSPAGACIPCTQDDMCMGNPGICRQGRTNCTTGTPTCLDGPGKPPGTMCGMNLVCDGDGGCVTCTDGDKCSTNPDPCKDGIQSCTGTPACNDSTQKMVGESCGVDRVCNTAGQCVACAAMQPCNTNPTECKEGRTSCATGIQTCVDGPDKMLGAVCSTGFCSAGGCVPCALGMACTTNPSPCKTGAFTRGGSNGAQCICGDDRDRPIGQVTGCSGTSTCNGMGACVQCGQSCTVTNPCQRGAVSCTDLSCAVVGPQSDGTTCTGGSCASGMCCTGCREGATCFMGSADDHCGTAGVTCRDCTTLTMPGPCMYTSACDTTGDRVTTVGMCTATMSCGTTTVTMPNDPSCNRAPQCNGVCHGDECCSFNQCFDRNSRTCVNLQPVVPSGQTVPPGACGIPGQLCSDFCSGGNPLTACRCNRMTGLCSGLGC